MTSQNKRLFSSTLQILVFAAVFLSLCEGFTMPLLWGRRDMGNCPAMMGNRDLYEELSRVCFDCQNIFRGKNIEGKCRSECFGSSYFETCVMALELAEKLTDYKMHASILKGGRK